MVQYDHWLIAGYTVYYTGGVEYKKTSDVFFIMILFDLGDKRVSDFNMGANVCFSLSVTVDVL